MDPRIRIAIWVVSLTISSALAYYLAYEDRATDEQWANRLVEYFDEQYLIEATGRYADYRIMGLSQAEAFNKVIQEAQGNSWL